MRRERVVADVSRLPTVVFGERNLASWGTTGFMIIETFTLALCAVTYIYLRKNTSVWPPHGTPLPSLLLPSINYSHNQRIRVAWKPWIRLPRLRVSRNIRDVEEGLSCPILRRAPGLTGPQPPFCVQEC